MKKKVEDKYEVFLKSISIDDKKELIDFFNQLSRHCILPNKEYELFERDFKNAILYYDSIGISIA
ncbi:MAG TPA: hypothetical protein PLC53_02975, partial [Bacilli bacterium]|nr:hypothetical protein [Bacilli bacterium]